MSRSQRNRKRRHHLWNLQKGLCFYCRKDVPKNKCTIDHVVPMYDLKNGVKAKVTFDGQEIGNYVMACHSCNIAKANKPLDAFMNLAKHKINKCEHPIWASVVNTLTKLKVE